MTINLLGALATAFIICAVTGPSLFRFAKLNLGRASANAGPKEQLKKSGTPTMGGIMMLLAILVGVAVWCNLHLRCALRSFLTFAMR